MGRGWRALAATAADSNPAGTGEYRPLPGKPQRGVVPDWAYQWLVPVPEPEGSWVLPGDMQSHRPAADTPLVAIRRIEQACAARAPDTLRPVVVLDSAHDVAQLVRLAKNRALPPRSRPVLWPRSAAQACSTLQATG